MIDFVKEAEAIFPTLVACRRDLHQHPELGGQEVRTKEGIAATLESLGIEVEREVGTRFKGVVGFLRGGQPGPTVALRADIDALPIQEIKDLPYKSQNPGFMHACGHDAHTTIALGAARILASHRDELKGNVKFIFQPNEEREGGAEYMIEAGVLNDVSAIFGLHVDPEYPTSLIVTKPQAVMAASDRLSIDIKGLSAHGAAPQRGVDAVVMASQFVMAVQTLVSRELDPLDSAVVTFGVIRGGETRNVICNNVHLEGILRTLRPEVRERTISRMKKMLDGIAETFGGSYDFQRVRSYPATINDEKLVGFAKETAIDLFGAQQFMDMPGSRLGCEDFSYYLEKVPGVFWFLGVANKEKDSTHPWHSDYFDIDEDALKTGAALQSALVYRYLEQRPEASRS